MTKTRVIDKYNKMLSSKWFLISISIIFLVIYALQVYSFVNNGLINNIDKQSPDAWKVWTTITLTTFGAITSFISTVMTIKFKNSFFKYQLISSLMIIISDILFFLWFDMFKMIFLTILFYLRLKEWQKSKDENLVVNSLGMKNLLFHILTGFCIVGVLGSSMWFINEYTIIKDPVPYLDAFNMTFLIYACFLLIRTNKESWLMFMMSDMMVFITFAILGVWSYAIMGFIYVFMDFFTYLSWDEHYKKQQVKQH